MSGQWRKSTFSGAGQEDCVEIDHADVLRIRDSKNPDAGVLTVPTSAWAPHHFPARPTTT